MTVTLERPRAAECRDLSAQIRVDGAAPVIVRGRIVGPDGAPVVAVLGGISSGRILASDAKHTGWWYCQAGPGRALDTGRLRLLSLDFAGEEIAPFPSTADQARAVLALADAAGIERFGFIGASYGGMVGLALAALAPQRIDRLLAISAAHRASAMAQAWRSIQRDTVELALRLGDGAAGLDLARRLAMTTYRTPEEFETRFCEPQPGTRDAGGVAAYLEARGQAYAAQVEPARFLALSRSMDEHSVDPAVIQCPVTYLAVIEDRLVPVDQIAEAAGRTPQGRLLPVHSVFGHDAFLKEEAAISAAIHEFLGS